MLAEMFIGKYPIDRKYLEDQYVCSYKYNFQTIQENIEKNLHEKVSRHKKYLLESRSDQDAHQIIDNFLDFVLLCIRPYHERPDLEKLYEHPFLK